VMLLENYRVQTLLFANRGDIFRPQTRRVSEIAVL
jgi:hypothetical protein